MPDVPACQETTIADADLTRLPRNQAEGHLPRIAVVTGHAGAYECLVRNIGISDSEFTNDAGTGRVHLYYGGAGDITASGARQTMSGQMFSDAYTTLFPSASKLAQYDYVLLSCEGTQLTAEKEPHLAKLKGYADGGGRLFLEHSNRSGSEWGSPPGRRPPRGSASALIRRVSSPGS